METRSASILSCYSHSPGRRLESCSVYGCESIEAQKQRSLGGYLQPKMACGGRVADMNMGEPQSGPVSPADFSGFESEHSSKDEDAAETEPTAEQPEMSEFIRNLPGLPASNPALFDNVTLKHSNNNQFVSCVESASGPLEDSISKVPVTEAQDNAPVTVKVEEKSSRDKSSRDKSRHSSSRSSRECKKCYERRKVKRSNVGVQCRIEKQVVNKGSHHQYSLSRPLISSNSMPSWEKHKYSSLMNVELYPNGGGTVVHMHQDEIDRLNLSDRELRDLAEEFFQVWLLYID